ncbi:uncharacterized protein G2W53_007528 [Senna tora]|uniref:Uncharacterized protein n=1 Tax=Senna tora TaxID=362788 RepID=A0A834X6B5_9FABA|nr:uncharacterized protein G2W53_007528 [Senna tora]
MPVKLLSSKVRPISPCDLGQSQKSIRRHAFSPLANPLHVPANPDITLGPREGLVPSYD